jgi:serine/threonine-protein kinase
VSRSDDSVTAVELVDPLVGTIFDKRFRVEERLAAGGFGAIYKATHVKSGHQIALKVLHPTLASDLGVLARFRREGTTLTSLRNPHTITAYEFGQADKTLFIVLERPMGHHRTPGCRPISRPPERRRCNRLMRCFLSA